MSSRGLVVAAAVVGPDSEKLPTKYREPVVKILAAVRQSRFFLVALPGIKVYKYAVFYNKVMKFEKFYAFKTG